MGIWQGRQIETEGEIQTMASKDEEHRQEPPGLVKLTCGRGVNFDKSCAPRQKLSNLIYFPEKYSREQRFLLEFPKSLVKDYRHDQFKILGLRRV